MAAKRLTRWKIALLNKKGRNSYKKKKGGGANNAGGST